MNLVVMSETEVKRKFERDLARVKDSIIAASEHYNIWYIYKNKDYRPKYVNVMNRYLGFFRASISAHFTAILLNLSKSLDRNTNKRTNIYSLLQLVEKHNLIQPSELREIKSKLNKIRDLFGKVQILRNNYFAHLGAKLDSKESFKHAGISPNDLKKLIDLSIEILRSIYYAYDRGDFVFDYGSKEDAYSLLNDLLKMNNS